MYVDYFEINNFTFEIICNENYLVGLKTVKEKAEIKTSILTEKVKNQLCEYFKGKRKSFDIPICFSGTEFQNKVWKELLNIPYGKTRSYKDIAKEVGNEKASRAVGGANNKNPIWIIVPCHRVIGKNGELVGYGGGLKLKEFLLSIEKIGRD